MAIKKSNTAIICLSPYSGGMEIDALKLANKLYKFTNITLVAKEKHFIANSFKEYIKENIELRTIEFKSTFSLSIISKVRELVKEKKIKNVIFFGASEMKSLYFAFLGLDINLIIRHGTTKSKPKKDWFHRLIYSQVNHHVSICKHLEKNVKYIIPFGKSSKSELIYSSFELQKKEKIPHDKLTLVHVGRIAEGKGQYDAIEACEVLYKNNIDFTFYIIGGFDESYKEKFLDLYNSLEYKKNIKLVGFVKNVQDYLLKSDVFIFPSYGEGLSNAFLEALANDLICISYENTSFPELKDLGLYFHMLEDKNIEILKEKLLYICKNIDVEKKKLKNNSLVIEEKFSLNREIKEYMEILEV